MTALKTARLTLRRARIEDLAAMHAILSNAEATRFWSAPPHAIWRSPASGCNR